MKKNLALLLLLSVFLFSFKSDKIKNSLSGYNLKGNVKALHQCSYAIQPKTTDDTGKLFFKITATFNEKGNLVERKQINYDGVANSSYTCKYNDKDEAISDNGFHGKWTFKDTSMYNEDGTMAEMDYTKINDGKTTIYKYILKHNGDKVSEKTIFTNNKLTEKDSYTYGTNGKLSEIDSHKPNGKLSEKYTYQYDSNGNTIEVAYYKANGKLDYKHSYKYEGNDSAGNWMKCITYYNTRPIYITVRKLEYY